MKFSEERTVILVTMFDARHTDEELDENGKVVSTIVEENIETKKYIFIDGTDQVQLTSDEDQASLFLESQVPEIMKIVKEKFGYKNWFRIYGETILSFNTNEECENGS